MMHWSWYVTGVIFLLIIVFGSIGMYKAIDATEKELSKDGEK